MTDKNVERFTNFDISQFTGGVNANIPNKKDRQHQAWDGVSGKQRKDDTSKKMLEERGAFAETRPTKISSSVDLEAAPAKPTTKKKKK